jgi:hypothetical protein
LRAIRPTVASSSRRLLSTAPATKKSTWKGTGLRWGLAIAAVYFYNTSPIFADELPRTSYSLPTSSPLRATDTPSWLQLKQLPLLHTFPIPTFLPSMP